MMEQAQQKRPLDGRIVAYRFVRLVVLAALCGLAIKYALLDTVLVRTDHMAPSILAGDRIVVIKTHGPLPIKWVWKLRRGRTVVFRQPFRDNALGCLRIAATAGDVVDLRDGVLSLADSPSVRLASKPDTCPSLPADYSPRDFFAELRLPRAGDAYRLDSLNTRDMLFAWSMIQQENPNGGYVFKPWLAINDTVNNDYFVTDFSLYKGPFKAIPEELTRDWFFWDRLREYLRLTLTSSQVSIRFSILQGESALQSYRVHQSYYFLIADNWHDGLDSRYFGPVAENAIDGRVAGVLWSFDQQKGVPFGMRPSRICKIVR
jgi:signal peptidase I